jgi:hypothetical protein
VLIPELINNDNLYLYRLVQSSVRQDDIEMNINFPRVPHWNMFAVYADHHGVSAFGGRIGQPCITQTGLHESSCQ